RLDRSRGRDRRRRGLRGDIDPHLPMGTPLTMATTTPTVPGPSSAHAATDVWDRMERLWDGLFLGMLALPTVFALTDAQTAAGDRVAARVGSGRGRAGAGG
ncbi:MAG TPA: hypothetical protein VMM13_01160, partial [Euzebya sp.]|nr:hypothetical protein [Euzebya sp.]